MALLPESIVASNTGHVTDTNQVHKKLNAARRDVKADYGAAGNGTTDDTAAVQAALNAGGITFFPVGTYLVGKLTVPHAAVMIGVNSGTYNNTFSASQVSKLKLKNATNDHLLYVPTTSNRVLIRDLELDGNKGNQSGTGHGILFAPDTAQNEAQAIVERVYVHDAAQSGIRVDGWRQAVHLNDCVSNFNAEHGFHIIGTDCVVDKPIAGDNVGSGVVVSGNVTIVRAGALYNNQYGIIVTSSTRRVKLEGNGIDKNLQHGINIESGCAAVTIIGGMMTSNGRQTNNTYAHIYVGTTTGLVTVVGVGFSGLEPGVTNQTTYALQLAAGATAYEAGNLYESGSVGGFCNDTNRLYVTTRPTFREAASMWSSDATASVAAQGLDLPSALTELDATFGGTRRTITPDQGGREVQMSVRFRKTVSSATQTVVVSIRNTANTPDVLTTVSQAVTNAAANYEAVSAWAATPSWFTALSSATVAVYTSGGNGADDFVLRDVTLRWRG